jgi:hypothetical protein
MIRLHGVEKSYHVAQKINQLLIACPKVIPVAVWEGIIVEREKYEYRVVQQCSPMRIIWTQEKLFCSF